MLAAELCRAVTRRRAAAIDRGPQLSKGRSWTAIVGDDIRKAGPDLLLFHGVAVAEVPRQDYRDRPFATVLAEALELWDARNQSP
jgi:hypothetical protein